MIRSKLAASFLLLGSLISLARPQEPESAKRPDGKITPLLVYRPKTSGAPCPPLAVISHGAGGSENGYVYLAQALSDEGFTAVVMGHRESGLDALKSRVQNDGIRNAVRDLVVDENVEQARLLDVTAALQWADARCRAPFRVLLGHSMGSTTVMLEAGAKNMIKVTAPPATQDRFDAYVALSPQGPGIVFPDRAWSSIHKPMLILTGTRDEGLQGGPESRRIPWSELPGSPRHCQWMGVIDGATHMNFAGVGPGANRVEPLVTHTIRAFLADASAHACAQPPAMQGLTLQLK